MKSDPPEIDNSPWIWSVLASRKVVTFQILFQKAFKILIYQIKHFPTTCIFKEGGLSSDKHDTRDVDLFTWASDLFIFPLTCEVKVAKSKHSTGAEDLASHWQANLKVILFTFSKCNVNTKCTQSVCERAQVEWTGLNQQTCYNEPFGAIETDGLPKSFVWSNKQRFRVSPLAILPSNTFLSGPGI